MAKQQYTIRRKVLALLGAQFHIYNAEGKLVGYCKQKAFKLKEDIRIYADESATKERMLIRARSILDISATYDIMAGETEEKIGVLKRQGLKSILRDEWTVMDAKEREIGKVIEDSHLMAMLSRFVRMIPQTYHLKDNSGNKLAELRQHFNPFVQKLTVTVEDGCHFNPYLVLAAGILLAAIEGRQE